MQQHLLMLGQAGVSIVSNAMVLPILRSVELQFYVVLRPARPRVPDNNAISKRLPKSEFDRLPIDILVGVLAVRSTVSYNNDAGWENAIREGNNNDMRTSHCTLTNEIIM
jgi:hypothetical protein